jgi:von Willebrand factor type A domain
MFRPLPRFRTLGLIACAVLICGAAWAQGPRLEYADKVRLVNCQPSTAKPCFRLKLNIVDEHGSPVNLNLPPDKDLRDSLKVLLDDQEIRPFYAISEAGTAQVARGRIALVLVDISGSMNQKLASGQTRFSAAQAALQQFLAGFDSASDRVAIVPFESHRVVDQFHQVRFARTKDEALQQIGALPAPGPKNNTALYSAVVLGLQTLQQQSSGVTATDSTSPEMLLIVMTDGKNEVYKGDDEGLLDGPAGLKTAADAVQKSGIQVIGIGFGDPGSVDEGALRIISSKEYLAQDLDKLSQIFSVARTLLTNRIVATIASPWDDRASLEGRSLRVKARLSLPGGAPVDSGEQLWSAPQIGIPAFEGKCDTEELKAALPIPAGAQSWLSMVRPVLVFFGLGTLLLALWFWVPRLIWPEQYIGAFPTVSRGTRWASASHASSVSKPRAKSPAPPGFQTWKGGAQPPRAPLDKTVIQPKPDFSRSRVEKRPRDDNDS